MKKVILSTLLTLGFLSQNGFALHIDAVKSILDKTKKEIKTITNSELKKMIDSDEDFYIIDIREPDQVPHGEIFHYNLIQITRGYLEFKVEKAIPNKDAKVVIYCCTGKRSVLATRSLKEMGYKNVYSLEGGIQKWVHEGFPLDTVYGEVVYKK